MNTRGLHASIIECVLDMESWRGLGIGEVKNTRRSTQGGEDARYQRERPEVAILAAVVRPHDERRSTPLEAISRNVEREESKQGEPMTRALIE